MEPRSDPRLEAAIRAVGAWRGRDIGVTPVSVGHDERHYLIEADGELFMLRLASPSSDRPRVDGTGELEVARAASSAGVAPEVTASLPQLGCLVTRFAPGRRLDPSDAERDDVLASVVGSIRALHACPPPGIQRSVFREARELRRIAIASGTAMPGSEPAAAETVRGIEDVVTAEPRTMVACHGDLTPSSLLLDGEHVWIIDYRWAGAGDAFEDLGSVAAHLRLSDARSDALLRGYFGTATGEHRSRLDLWRTAAEYLGALRALTRAGTEVTAELTRVLDARLAHVAAATVDASSR
jgi:aminoglycoside phosphotransferase (APT) family kinase protein